MTIVVREAWRLCQQYANDMIPLDDLLRAVAVPSLTRWDAAEILRQDGDFVFEDRPFGPVFQSRRNHLYQHQRTTGGSWGAGGATGGGDRWSTPAVQLPSGYGNTDPSPQYRHLHHWAVQQQQLQPLQPQQLPLQLRPYLPQTPNQLVQQQQQQHQPRHLPMQSINTQPSPQQQQHFQQQQQQKVDKEPPPPAATTEQAYFNTVRVSNLHGDVTTELLYELFLQAGPVCDVRQPAERDGSGRLANFAFVEFVDALSGPYAMQLLADVPLLGLPMRIRPAN